MLVGSMALTTMALGIGLASPAGACTSSAPRARDHYSASDAGCDSRYERDSYQGRINAQNAPSSNESYCNNQYSG